MDMLSKPVLLTIYKTVPFLCIFSSNLATMMYKLNMCTVRYYLYEEQCILCIRLFGMRYVRVYFEEMHVVTIVKASMQTRNIVQTSDVVTCGMCASG